MGLGESVTTVFCFFKGLCAGTPGGHVRRSGVDDLLKGGFGGWREGFFQCCSLFLLGGVLVSPVDAQTPGLMLSSSLLTIVEGSSNTYTVDLTTQPSASVTVEILDHSGTDLTLDKTSLTFTTSGAIKWDMPQTASAGEDLDQIHDTETLTHTASGGGYASVIADVAVSVTDNLLLREIHVLDSAIRVGEGFSYPQEVWLHSEPTGTVVVDIMPSDAMQVTVSPARLTFTPTDWSMPQTVNVTPVDNDISDLEVRLPSVTLTATGGAYEGVTQTFTVRILDDEPYTVSYSEGSTESLEFRVDVDMGEPPVVVTFTSSDITQVTVSPPSLTFTHENQLQSVTLNMLDNNSLGDMTAEISITRTPPIYEVIHGYIVEIRDNDVGVSLSVMPNPMAEGEDVWVRANLTNPFREVTIPVTLTAGTAEPDDFESITDITVQKGWLWGIGIIPTTNDADVDDETFTVMLGEPLPSGLLPASPTSVEVMITDNDEAVGIVLAPSSSLTVEEGSSDTYTVKLATRPSATVTVTITGHSGTDLALGTTLLTFDPKNVRNLWSTPQTVTVSAGEDGDAANDTATLLHTASGGDYAGKTASLAVTTTDDDETGGIVLTPSSSLTVEEGSSDTYTVKLATQPSASVTVTITGHSGTDLTLGTTLLTFNPSGSNLWSTAQTVTVSAGEDEDAANDTATLLHTASGGDYADETASLAVTTTDDETVGIVLTPSSSLTVEEGSSDTYTVKLATRPSATVMVTITGHSGTDLTLGTTLLTFNPSGSNLWSTVQTVTVSAGEDGDAANDTATLLHTASGGDYAGETASLAVTITDDEAVGIVLTPSSSLTVEEGSSDTYTVKLATQPSATVMVTITGHSGTDLAVDKTLLTFNPSGSNLWSTAQTVTVSAGEDEDAANDTATLLHTASGGDYADETASLAVTTTDDDETVGIVLVPSSSLTVEEGSSDTYTVKLATQPSATVTVTITGHSGTDLTLGTTLLTFNPSGSNLWSTAQTVTVSAGEDGDAANDAATLLHTASGGDYAGETASLAVTTTDDEATQTRAVNLSVTPNPVDEGGSATVTVTLSRAIPNIVTIPLTLTRGTAELGDYGSLAGVVILVGGTTGTGTISVVEDADQDDETFTVGLGALPEGLVPGNPSSVEVTIRDKNRPPTVTATCDPCVVAPGGSVRLTATASDPDGDPLTYDWSATWGGLDVPVDEPTVKWIAPAEPGQATIRVEVSDGRGGSASAEVEVEVVNSGPMFKEPIYRFKLPENLDGQTRPVDLGTAVVENPDGDELTYEIISGDRERFAVSSQDGVVRYIGRGEDFEMEPNRFELAVRVRDEFEANDAARVMVEVTDVNEFPEVMVSCDPCAVERGSKIRLEATAWDPDGDLLTYGWSATLGDLGVPVDEPTVRWTAPAEPGRAMIRVEVSDGRGGSASAEVGIEVINRPPTFEEPIYRFELPEHLDGREQPVKLGTVAAEDPDGDELTYEIVFGDREHFTVGAQDGVVSYINAGEDFETEPNRYELTVRVRDKFGADTSIDVVVTVTNVNEPPEVIALCDPCAVPRGGEVRLEATATDPDGNPLIHGWSADKGEFLGPSEASQAIWKAPADTGRVEVRVEVSDGHGGSASDAVTVDVFNRPPAFARPSYDFKLSEDMDGRERPIDIGRVMAEDPDGDVLMYEIVSADHERFAVGALDGVVRYVGPGEDFERVPNRFTMILRVRDEFGGEVRIEVVVEVTDVNEVPEAADDEAVTSEDESTTVDVLANDTDPEGGLLRVQSVTAAAHGTTRLALGGRVIYTPESDFHGADSFTYVASDTQGLTDTASVEVTVLPVNDAPTAVGTIPDQVLDEGGGAVHVGLSSYFGDVDGDTFTYGAWSSDTSVVLASVSGAVLTLTPVVYGSATVTIEAADPTGLSATQSVRVGVSDRPQRAILRNMLAATARSHLASLRTALGRRMAAGPCEASRLAVLGRPIPLGRTEAATVLGQIGAGTLDLSERAGEPIGTIHLSTLAAEMTSETADRMEAILRSVPARVLDLGDMSGAGAADFLFGWSDSEEGSEECPVHGRWSLWGQGDMQRFEGMPSVHGYDSGYDGELLTAYLGLDTRLGEHWLAGVALSRSKGTGDWRVGTSEGRLTQFMTAVHPYLRWTGGPTSVWTSVGTGRGDAQNVRAAGRAGTSPTSFRLGLVEFERRLGAPGKLGLAIKGDAAWARLRAGEGEETIDGQDITVNQVRIGADLSLFARLGSADLTPFGTMYARRDGGAGQTGSGIEVAGGLRTALGIVRLDAQARLLALHSAEGYDERGAAVTLSLGKQVNEEGFSLSISPRWGDPARTTGALLNAPLGGGRSGGQDSDRWTLDARANYGVNLPGGLRLDLQSSFGDTRGGLGFGLHVAMSATATTKLDR